MAERRRGPASRHQAVWTRQGVGSSSGRRRHRLGAGGLLLFVPGIGRLGKPPCKRPHLAYTSPRCASRQPPETSSGALPASALGFSPREYVRRQPQRPVGVGRLGAGSTSDGPGQAVQAGEGDLPRDPPLGDGEDLDVAGRLRLGVSRLPEVLHVTLGQPWSAPVAGRLVVICTG